MNNETKIIIIQNIISPYTITLFNELNKYSNNKIVVIYLAETMMNRDWIIEYERIEYEFYLMSKGPLDNVNMISLSLRLLKFLIKHRYNNEIYIIGEYSNIAYWTSWLYAVLKRCIIGARLEMFEEAHAKPTNCIKEFIKRMFFYKCDFVLAAGEKHKKYAISLGMSPQKVFNIHGVGGVNRDIYEDCIRRLEVNRDNAKNKLKIPTKNNFIFVGRLSPEKNIRFLLEAFNDFSKLENASNWGLIILGNGPLRDDLNLFIKNNDIHNVYMPGFIQQRDIAPYFLCSDVLILPSINETWGLVVDEALSFGLAVIISNKCGCSPDIVRDDYNGVVIDPTDKQSLVNAMVKCMDESILNDKWKNNSRLVSKKYTASYSAQIIWDSIQKIRQKSH